MLMRKQSVLLVMIISISQVSVADLTVMIDTGKTLPVPSNMMPVNPDAFIEQFKQQQTRDKAIVADYSALFPVATPELTLGAVASRRAELPQVTVPLFLIGCDRTSVGWLKSREEFLVRFNSTGFVIECESLGLFRQLSALFPDLTLVPVHGQQLAEAFQLSNYPVVVTNQGVTQ